MRVSLMCAANYPVHCKSAACNRMYYATLCLMISFVVIVASDEVATGSISSMRGGDDVISHSHSARMAPRSSNTIATSSEFDSWKEKKLIQTLLSNYDRQARPVKLGWNHEIRVNTSIVYQVVIEFGLSLIQVIGLNEMDQVLTTSMRTLIRWRDPHLMWQPEEFANITHINIPTDQIWIPDIYLYNYADERLEEKRECDAVVRSDGFVEWHPMAIFKSNCPVQIKYFPFDTQRCKLKFGPWSHDGFSVNITFYERKAYLDRSQYVPSAEWQFVRSAALFHSISYPCCPDPFVDISFYVQLARHGAYHAYILVLPCLLLSCLTLLVFWLPSDSPAKLLLGMNIFLAFFLQLLVLEKMLPSASNSFPLIGRYYCVSMVMITLSSFICLLSVNLHFRGDSHKEVPDFLKNILFSKVAPILFINLNVTLHPSSKWYQVRSGGDVERPTRKQTFHEKFSAFRQKLKHKQNRNSRNSKIKGTDLKSSPNNYSKHRIFNVDDIEVESEETENSDKRSCKKSASEQTEPMQNRNFQFQRLISDTHSQVNRQYSEKLCLSASPPPTAQTMLPPEPQFSSFAANTSHETSLQTKRQYSCGDYNAIINYIDEEINVKCARNDDNNNENSNREKVENRDSQEQREVNFSKKKSLHSENNNNHNKKDKIQSSSKKHRSSQLTRENNENAQKSGEHLTKRKCKHNFAKKQKLLDEQLLEIFSAEQIRNIQRDLKELIYVISHWKTHHEKLSKVSRIYSEWRALSVVLDRIFFILYLFGTLASSFWFVRNNALQPEQSGQSFPPENI